MDILKIIKELWGKPRDYTAYTEQAKRDGWNVELEKLRQKASPMYTPHPALVEKDKENRK